MILKIILEIAITILSFLFEIIGALNPQIEFINYITPFLEIINDVFEFSISALYYLLGDSMYAFINFAISLLGIRYILYPIIVIIRRIIIKGGDT